MERVNPFSIGSVPETPDLLRVERLPRRSWESVTPQEVALVSQAFRRPEGSQTLRPVQVAALLDIAEVGGGFLPMGVGTGKTLVTFLAPKILEAKRPLLMVPAKLRDKTLREVEKARAHWMVPNFHLISYELLSREGQANFLEEYQPDLIVADEAHKLKNPKAAVTRRVARYLRSHRPAVVFASGSFTRRSLMDYWHLVKWALGADNSPLPQKWEEASLWAFALDAKDHGFRPSPGALSRLLPPGKLPLLENVRGAFRDRLTQTRGVVATSDTGYSGALLVEGCIVQLPESLGAHYKVLRDQWETPDGHPFSEAVDLWRHARELACGFYYRWNPRPPEEWLVARKLWCKFVRDTLGSSRSLDSELQVANAVKAGRLGDPHKLLTRWSEVRDTFTPNQEAVWLDDTTLQLAAVWLKHHKGLCWVEHRAVGERLSQITGLPYYGQGGLSKAKKSIEDEKGPCILSIPANNEGRNLQDRYHQNFILSCPPSGATLEQLLGRTHRPGQEAEEVEAQVVLACREQLDGLTKALEESLYIQQTTGNPQKLCLADLTIPQASTRGAQW